jgi:hypothetical protein
LRCWPDRPRHWGWLSYGDIAHVKRITRGVALDACKGAVTTGNGAIAASNRDVAVSNRAAVIGNGAITVGFCCTACCCTPK